MRERGKINHHLRPFQVEHLEEAVLLEQQMNLLVLKSRIARADIQSVCRRAWDISAHANHLARIAVLEKILGGMDAEYAATAQQYEGLQWHFLSGNVQWRCGL